jgi:ketosteroid isomerase-like protein
VHEHPNAAVVRRSYEAQARGDLAALEVLVERGRVTQEIEGRTPLSIAAAGDIAVVIDRAGEHLGVTVFRVKGGRIAEITRMTD